MDELDPTFPKWEQIRDRIAADIAAGRLKSGDQVPSAAALVERYGVAMATAQKALAALKRDGLVRSQNGIGTFVL
ncbi:GntR family transcriptional regulator [Streptomyces chitinivorans]|uniref:GntR family transcriptional regulator n=1 Tax=Streptomyces chitinivorans TaxID=1257027 RepID=UPI0024475CCB|nr:winged helix-turn-helix domain-containing protein [Streptomyces chitinivorans]MDH2409627.1 winged helix-turn-helix domain-containing protein [Streptomyces chitinivorans]